jgi:hypothetical protein
MDFSRYIIMAYGVILKHSEVDKITWGVKETFSAGKRCGALFLTGVENNGEHCS